MNRLSIIEIGNGALTAQFAPREGGRLARLQWRRRAGEVVEVVVPFVAGLDGLRWPKAGAYPLIPYANRIVDARLRLYGEEVALQAHRDAAPHTLHGHTQLVPWTASCTREQVELVHASGRTEAWPWMIEARQHFNVDGSTLRVELSVRNADSRPMPAGLGWHPYFLRTGNETLTYEATDWWPHREDYLPEGQAQAPLDALRSPLRFGDRELTAYLGGWTGTLSILRSDGVRIALSGDKVFDHLVLHCPERAAYLCVEPVTHLANGFNLAEDGIARTGRYILEPGEKLRGSLVITLSEDGNA